MLKKTQIITAIKAMGTRPFWREYISIYSSIVIVTSIVQSSILHIPYQILFLCLLKSLVTTIPNVLTILFGRKNKTIQRHWFLETILYTLASMPYLEITLIYLYSEDRQLLFDMIQWYLIAYFIMGLCIKTYIKTTKQVISVSYFMINPWIKRNIRKSQQLISRILGEAHTGCCMCFF